MFSFISLNIFSLNFPDNHEHSQQVEFANSQENSTTNFIEEEVKKLDLRREQFQLKVSDHDPGLRPLYDRNISILRRAFASKSSDLKNSFKNIEMTAEEMFAQHSMSNTEFAFIHHAFAKALSGQSNVLSRHLNINRLMKYKIFALPIVSQNGILQISEINFALSKKITLLGVPTQRSGYDGAVNRPQDEFLRHDMGHALAFFDFSDENMSFYTKYIQKIIHTINPLILTIDNLHQRNKLALILFILTHENYGVNIISGSYEDLCRLDLAFSKDINDSLTKITSPESKDHERQNRVIADYEGYVIQMIDPSIDFNNPESSLAITLIKYADEFFSTYQQQLQEILDEIFGRNSNH
ncbi:MAG: hypothetical protein KC505_06510 [Myxococcales bacterium]|nr:hypothetical protein [Myxococcales bacterium]USN50763.1 MAG: hypothetical protein H6731_10995 [Myxococcales bacterium]